MVDAPVASVAEPNAMTCVPAGNDVAAYWLLDPDIAFLNHGSFGACPVPVLETQQEYRRRLERQPVQFFVRDLERLLDDARGALAEFLGADAADLAWVPNATTAVNAVLQSLTLAPGDELLTTDHEYNACRNALASVAGRAGARVVVAEIPFPLSSEDEIISAVLASVSDRTRLLLLDHVTSQTGLVLPVQPIIDELAARGIPVFIDGAHAPGMIPLDLSALGAAYYTGNCHKWLCAPKGAGFLHVQREQQADIHPSIVSHGANSPRTDRSRFLIEFDWMGTVDPSAILTVPAAIEFMGSLLDGGWPALMTANRTLVTEARVGLCQALRIEPPCPDRLLGSMAALPLPPGDGDLPASPLYGDPLQDRLLADHGIEVPIIPWPAPPERLLRVSAQCYNHMAQYDRLAAVLPRVLVS